MEKLTLGEVQELTKVHTCGSVGACSDRGLTPAPHFKGSLVAHGATVNTRLVPEASCEVRCSCPVGPFMVKIQESWGGQGKTDIVPQPKEQLFFFFTFPSHFLAQDSSGLTSFRWPSHLCTFPFYSLLSLYWAVPPSPFTSCSNLP